MNTTPGWRSVRGSANPRVSPTIQLLQPDLPQRLRHLRQPLTQEPGVRVEHDRGREQQGDVVGDEYKWFCDNNANLVIKNSDSCSWQQILTNTRKWGKSSAHLCSTKIITNNYTKDLSDILQSPEGIFFTTVILTNQRPSFNMWFLCGLQ